MSVASDARVTLTAQRPVAVLDEERALSLYLEALFREPDADAESSSVTEAHASPNASLTHELGLRPDHAAEADGEAVEVLFLKLGSANIAVNVVEIGALIKWPPNARVLRAGAGPEHWLIAHQGKRFVVLDTASLLFKAEADPCPSHGNGYDHVLVLQNGGVGLACYGAERIARIARADIAWRTNKSGRQCIEGVIKESLCMLVNTTALCADVEGIGDSG